MNDWTGRTAVITGAASGFGLEPSRVDAARGMNLVMADVQQETLDTAAAEIRGLGAQVLAFRFDVSCWHQQRSIAKASGVWRQQTGSFRISHLARSVTGAGRQRQFATFGCSRSTAILARSAVAPRERPLSQGSDFSTCSANDRLLSAPVARPKKCRRRLWVEWEHARFPFRHSSPPPSQIGERGFYEVVVRRARTVAIVVRAIANDRSGEAERASRPR